MGEKRTCKLLVGHYVRAMRAAVSRYSLGESYLEHVLGDVGVTVGETTKARNEQADAKSAWRRLYYKKPATKRLRAKRTAKKKNRSGENGRSRRKATRRG